MHTLVLVKDQFIKEHALGEKVDLWTVHPPSVDNLNTGFGDITMSMLFTLMMLESDVKVYMFAKLETCIITVNYIKQTCSLQWTPV